MEGKTRILATNSLHLTLNCKHILVLKGGKIVEDGEFNELQSKQGEFARLLQSKKNANDQKRDQKDKEEVKNDK